MSSMGLRLLSAEFQLVWICRSKIIPHSPATAWAEGAQLHGRPFPATASAEGAQFNVPPFPATASAEGAQLHGRPPSPARIAIAAVFIGYKGWCIALVALLCQTKRRADPCHRVFLTAHRVGYAPLCRLVAARVYTPRSF